MPLLTIKGNVYDYPSTGTPPGWGEGATDWAQAVTNVLSTLLAPGDILQSSFAIDNKTLSYTNINLLSFDGAVVRAANVSYAIYRTSSTNLSGKVEQGTLFLTYDNAAASGSKWIISRQNSGESGVSFNCTDAGQVQYISTDIGATSYSGIIKFSARTLST